LHLGVSGHTINSSIISMRAFLATDKAVLRIDCTWDRFLLDHWDCKLVLVSSFSGVMLPKFPLWPVAFSLLCHELL
jgi:hypothetical protein